MIEGGRNYFEPATFCGDGAPRTTARELKALLANAPDGAHVSLRIAGYTFETVGIAVADNGSGDTDLMLELDAFQSEVLLDYLSDRAFDRD